MALLPIPKMIYCTWSATRPRQLALRPREEHAVLQMARQHQTTDEFTQRYKKRAGVEGTMGQGTGAYGLRRSRYRGLARTHLQHMAMGVAISLQRLDDRWTETPRAATRPSRFAALAACGGRKWQERTPAMAAGLTDHIWTLEEMLRYRVLPVTGTPAPRQTDEVGRARVAKVERARAKPPATDAVA